MGDFFDNAVIFLEEYYVYVIGVGLIIILMLIGFLASRRKARKDNNQSDSMANINEVNTGSIHDVASTLQSNNVTSVTDVKLPDNNAVVTPQPVAASGEETEVLETAPVANDSNSFVNPVMPEVEQNVSPVSDNNNPASPFTEEAKADNEDKFNKTEVIDFSSLGMPEPMADIKPISSMMNENNSFNEAEVNNNEPITLGTINQTADTAVKMPVTDINVNEPTPIQTVNPMPANESITEVKVSPAIEEVENEPITDIKPVENNSFIIDKSQYSDILNGETSSSQESKM
jgi:type II secretory pathway pseudopilin PulG